MIFTKKKLKNNHIFLFQPFFHLSEMAKILQAFKIFHIIAPGQVNNIYFRHIFSWVKLINTLLRLEICVVEGEILII